ncbi:MAG: transcriptional repressor [Gammaproteobacteria bacterium]|nr:transcriptional repressor [Gammaproteobacteria bacterium]
MSAYRLTTKRRQFVELLEQANTPLSAYEIIDRYNEQFDARVLAPSAYRILNSLIEAGFVHRLETCNKYVACAHETDQCCDDAAPQFFICDRCDVVQELHIPSRLVHELRDSGAAHGFEVRYPQIELHGVCRDCAEPAGGAAA